MLPKGLKGVLVAGRCISANGGAIVGYDVQTAVDGKNNLIVDSEVTNKSNDRSQLHSLATSCKNELKRAINLLGAKSLINQIAMV